MNSEIMACKSIPRMSILFSSTSRRRLSSSTWKLYSLHRVVCEPGCFISGSCREYTAFPSSLYLRQPKPKLIRLLTHYQRSMTSRPYMMPGTGSGENQPPSRASLGGAAGRSGGRSGCPRWRSLPFASPLAVHAHNKLTRPQDAQDCSGGGTFLWPCRPLTIIAHQIRDTGSGDRSDVAEDRFRSRKQPVGAMHLGGGEIASTGP